ncbi:MAG: peptide-methionine (S)-S-oxide reductase MsrA [Candidatus Dactylopiibacterium sp.]|nr:peptide-methionine (S)-S-oxide reductase MsrA [Candidatus Dactylopiibacterium sp.]
MTETLPGVPPGRASAIFAGGCFWCLEAVFQRVRGVTGVTSGYIGGSAATATYEAVCAGGTGHAEAVRIEFDPAQLSYPELLSVFFLIHDPTQLNRQGNDVGTQYRSAIFHLDETQREEALAFIAALRDEEVFDAPIVTEVRPADVFHAAEAYHHDYFRRHPQQGYCSFVIAPKLAKFREHFAHLLDDKA